MQSSLCWMRDIHCVFWFLLFFWFFFPVLWNVVGAVTHCSPSRKDHCFSLSVLIIFMHMKKKSWLKTCGAGFISSPRWRRIKTTMTEKKKKTIVPCCCLYKHAFRFSLRSNCGFKKMGWLYHYSLLYITSGYWNTFMNFWWWDAESLRSARSLALTRLQRHTHGVYISAALTASLLKTFNNSPRISFATCRNKSWALIFDVPLRSVSWREADGRPPALTEVGFIAWT